MRMKQPSNLGSIGIQTRNPVAGTPGRYLGEGNLDSTLVNSVEGF